MATNYKYARNLSSLTSVLSASGCLNEVSSSKSGSILRPLPLLGCLYAARQVDYCVAVF